MASDSIKAITESLPPASDYLTYLTILECHISPEVLPTLNEILQDAELTQNIGWDLIHLLLPLPGSETCLTTIARLGNPREVVLKATEALQLLELATEDQEEKPEGETAEGSESTSVYRFCTLIGLLIYSSFSYKDKISLAVPFIFPHGYTLSLPPLEPSYSRSHLVRTYNFWEEEATSARTEVEFEGSGSN